MKPRAWTQLEMVKTYPLGARVVILGGIWQGIRGRVCMVDCEKKLVTIEFTLLTGKTLTKRPFQPDQIRPLSLPEMIGELEA